MAEEIDRLDQRIDQVTDQTLDSTRRILRTAEETNQIGVDTLVTLNEQGEKLDNVERRLDEINVDLKRTDKNLSEIEKCCGCFSCNCRRSYQVSVRGDQGSVCVCVCVLLSIEHTIAPLHCYFMQGCQYCTMVCLF